MRAHHASSRLLPRVGRQLRALVAVGIAVVVAGCGSAGIMAPPGNEGGTQVLFVGNSLTYTNDLPAMVERLARLAGDTALHVSMVAAPDFSLEDHWLDGTARQRIQSRRWDYVVLQQGPSALPESRVHLRTWASIFAPVIRDAGAQPVMLMVWPSFERRFDFPGVHDSYLDAARTIHAIFAPGGAAWTAYGSLDALYSDGLHPTMSGTYLAATALLERLRGVRPGSLPASIPGTSIDSATVRALQRAAEAALAANPPFPKP